MSIHLIRASILLLSSLAFFQYPPAYAAEERSPLTHGVMVGEVNQDSAVIWARTDRESTMHAWLRPAGGGALSHGQIAVSPDHDYTGKVLFRDLKPDSDYLYAVRFGGDASPPLRDPLSGRFRTAPAPDVAKSVRFAWGGDLAGQNVCRDAREGFPIFAALNRSHWDFFVAMGDMIYADDACDARGKYGNEQVPGEFGPAANKSDFWAHWRYSRDDRGFRDLLSTTPYLPVWDDHEVVNDFGPLQDTRDGQPYTAGQHLLPIGLAAFLDYNPIVPGDEVPFRLYRNIRWGKHVELLLLDTRQYRDANSAEDRADRPKTMLGREQLTWLKAKLKASNATWKFIVSSVSISTPTGSTPDKGRDGWANGDQSTGFEQELLNLLAYMKEEGIKNAVWLAADLHFAQGLRLGAFAKEPAFVVHEFVSGPMSAGLFPNRTLDPTLKPERLFFFGPEGSAKVETFQDAKHWMNIGAIEVNEAGALRVRVINARGDTTWTSGPLVPK